MSISYINKSYFSSASARCKRKMCTSYSIDYYSQKGYDRILNILLL